MRDDVFWTSVVHELRALPRETGWLEFKHNNAEPQEIGEYISALANTAALEGKAHAYLVWGIADTTHDVIGTSFDPNTKRVGNEELESWLLRQLAPKIGFHFVHITLDGRPLVLLEIDCAYRHPVQFAGAEFIRIGSYKKRLKDFQEKERELWRVLDATPFERLPAAEKLLSDEVLKLLDYPSYFDLIDRPLPDGRSAILDALAADRLIEPAGGGYWNVLNVGAILLAKQLSDFGHLQRKAVRVVVYKGKGRVETLREQTGAKGYAAAFKGLIDFIHGLLPVNEVIGQALRKAVPVYPELALRELVANALIHQDFSITGSGPMVEIFDDRMEITNPGLPLVDTTRMLDSPPRSRNEALASLMRRMGICEERGSGVDKVVFQTEFYQLPAPAFEVVGDSTRSTLFAPRPLTKMDQGDRVRAVYLHACLRYVQREFMTNTSLRERFGIDPKNSATASRLIKEALTAGVVRLHDPEAPPKLRRYVPSWA
ncbi:ATP-binding protein [Aquabacterium sp.]|uniref:ATP-binding protein n=1 Tax=Aquabacterium sp. TaxID=1872578 RepID=UPI003BAF66D3